MHIVIGLLTAVAGLFWAINAMKQSGAGFAESIFMETPTPLANKISLQPTL
ncbi:MAG: hypothetical protein V3U88_11075 [Methylococcales bacterium]